MSAIPPESEPDDFPPEASVERPRTRLHLKPVADDGTIPPDPEPQAEPFSEDALADEWLARHSQDTRYVWDWGKWFRWDGAIWSEDRDNWHYDSAREITRQALLWPSAAEALKTAAARRGVNGARAAANVVTLVRASRKIASVSELWDADPFMLATPAGVVDLTHGKLIESSREQYCTKRTKVAPAPGKCPLWTSILQRAARDDDSILSYLHRWAGYLLTGDTREECFMFVHGPGGSGKSTFVRVLSEVLGSYSRACNMDAFTARDHSEHSTEIAKLAGSRLVTATETAAGAKWHEPRIKQLTGRDKIAARFMRMDEFEFMPTFKIIIAGNHRPGLKTVGEEMRRRIHLVEFPDIIATEDRDLQLPDKLRIEYPQILAWAIAGTMQWLDAGLGKPERISDDTEQYLAAQDVLGSWIAECVERITGYNTRTSEAYKSYVTFAKERGEFEPSLTRFSEDMQARGFLTFKSSVKYFRDCRINPPVV